MFHKKYWLVDRQSKQWVWPTSRRRIVTHHTTPTDHAWHRAGRVEMGGAQGGRNRPGLLGVWVITRLPRQTLIGNLRASFAPNVDLTFVCRSFSVLLTYDCQHFRVILHVKSVCTRFASTPGRQTVLVLSLCPIGRPGTTNTNQPNPSCKDEEMTDLQTLVVSTIQARLQRLTLTHIF